MVAEVSVSAAGELKVHRIVAATDPGHVVNPQQVEAQVEGAAGAWSGDVTIPAQGARDLPLEKVAVLEAVGAFCIGTDQIDLRAARAAGMRVLALATTYPVEELGEADRVISSLAGVDPEALLRGIH